MAHLTKVFGTAGLSAVMWATPGVADITPDEAWEAWKNLLIWSTYDVTASEIRDGRDLIVRDMTARTEVLDGNDVIQVIVLLPDVTYQDRGDGSVALLYPQNAKFDVSVKDEDELILTGTIVMEHQGLTMIASGERDDVTFGFSAASVQYSLVDLMVPGEELPEIAFDLELSGLTGQNRYQFEDVLRATGRLDSSESLLNLRLIDPDGGNNLVLASRGSGFGFKVDSALPQNVSLSDPVALFGAGYDGSIEFFTDSGQTLASGLEEGTPFSFESANQGSSAEMSMNSDAFSMGFASLENSFSMAGGPSPLPFSGEIGEMAFSMLMPLSASETPRDFGIGFTLADIVVPELLWNIFDPSAILDHGPASMVLDLTGTTRIFTDLFDPAFEESDDVPAELTSLTLNELSLEFAGAQLQGDGDFTFDNTDMQSFDGFPRPEGSAQFRLLGGNQLLDNLSEMGAVSGEELLGARMMMGLFAVAGPGEDELSSTLEVNESGHVLANGQRLR